MKTATLRSSRDRLAAAVKTIQNARRAGEATYLTDGIYRDGQLFRFACSDLNERYARRRIDLVVAYDSTSLPLAAPLSYFVGTGLAVAEAVETKVAVAAIVADAAGVLVPVALSVDRGVAVPVTDGTSVAVE